VQPPVSVVLSLVDSLVLSLVDSLVLSLVDSPVEPLSDSLDTSSPVPVGSKQPLVNDDSASSERVSSVGRDGARAIDMAARRSDDERHHTRPTCALAKLREAREMG
jgi:hypothetical protein